MKASTKKLIRQLVAEGFPYSSIFARIDNASQYMYYIISCMAKYEQKKVDNYLIRL